MKEFVSSKDIIAAKKHNEPALAGIIAKKMPLIRFYAKRASRPGLDFDDAVQEGLIGLFSAIETFNEDKNVSFATYSSTCIRNSIFSASTAAGRKKHAPLNHSVPIPEEQSTPGPEEQAIVNEQLSLTLEKASKQLSLFEKKVLKLLLEGYSSSQISIKLSKPAKSVENALTRLRHKLRT